MPTSLLLRLLAGFFATAGFTGLAAAGTLKRRKCKKMKTFSEKSHLGIVAAMVGCCRADWWMRGYCSLCNIKKLKDAKEIMNKVNQENHEAKSSELSEIRFT